MVCAAGEKILADLDDYGIKILRRERLVWSGFGPMNRIEPDVSLSDLGPDLTDYGIRKICIEDEENLRKFFLSLLWRASVSKLPEMQEVQLSKVDEERLKSYLLGEETLPIAFYPCWLTQHHQVGFPHNQTPIRRLKQFPFSSELPEQTVSVYRFYFDGLVSHFHEVSEGENDSIATNMLTVGYAKELAVTCVPWSKSAQLENLVHVARESLW